MRSKWKGYFIAPALLENFQKKDPAKAMKIFSRGSTILPEFEGHTFLVYNGRKFESVLVTPGMFFHKFGEYSLTKKIGYPIHMKKGKKGRNKRR